MERLGTSCLQNLREKVQIQNRETFQCCQEQTP